MTKFTATFTNGHVATRNSEHPYRFAIGYFEKATGKAREVTFTAAETPKASWQTIGLGDCFRGYGSTAQKAKWQKKVEAERQNFYTEIVAVA